MTPVKDEFHTHDYRPISDLWWENATQPIIRKHEKIGRNQSCPCGSGKKYKKCCNNKKRGKNDNETNI